MSNDKMRELIEELWESDAACALTNRAARALESALHSVEAQKEPVTQEMIKAGLDAIGPCMGSCGEASPPDGEDVEACYLAMKELDQATTGMQTESDPVAFAKDGNLFWHGDPTEKRGVNCDLFASPQPSPQVPEGFFLAPREFLEEYIQLLEGVEYKAIHKLARINGAKALLNGIIAAPSIAEKEDE